MDKLTPPVMPGDEISVRIEALGSKGDGIAKIDKFIIFVKGAQPDKTYDVKVDKVFDKFAFASIKE